MENVTNMVFTSDDDRCPTCRGTGRLSVWKYIPELYGDDGAPVEYDAGVCPTCHGGRLKEKEVESIRKRASIPEVFSNDKIDAFRWDVYTKKDGSPIDTSKQKKVVDSFWNDFRKWQDKGMGLYVFSRTKGSGKTFLSSCLTNTIIGRYAIRARFESAVNLISIQQRADKDSPRLSESDPITDMANVPLLVLDDIGAKDSNTWIDEILFTITDRRMQRKLPTIMTSNMPIAELPYSDRIVDRINAICIQVDMPEVCIRARESNTKKASFIKSLGLSS